MFDKRTPGPDSHIRKKYKNMELDLVPRVCLSDSSMSLDISCDSREVMKALIATFDTIQKVAQSGHRTCAEFDKHLEALYLW